MTFIKSISATVMALCLGVGAAQSAQIGVADFTNPAIDEFNDVGLFQIFSGPLVRGGTTFTSNNGSIRAFTNTGSFPTCFDGCILTDGGGNTEPGVLAFIDATFASPFTKVGAFVGAAVAPNAATVEFFDTSDNLIDIVSINSGAGDVFAGFEFLAGISRVRFNDTSDQNFNMSIDRLFTEGTVAPVPLPAAGWMLLASLGGVVAARRKRKS